MSRLRHCSSRPTERLDDKSKIALFFVPFLTTILLRQLLKTTSRSFEAGLLKVQSVSALLSPVNMLLSNHHTKERPASVQDPFYLKLNSEKMAAKKESESDALPATENTWCAVFKYAPSACVALHQLEDCQRVAATCYSSTATNFHASHCTQHTYSSSCSSATSSSSSNGITDHVHKSSSFTLVDEIHWNGRLLVCSAAHAVATNFVEDPSVSSVDRPSTTLTSVSRSVPCPPCGQPTNSLDAFITHWGTLGALCWQEGSRKSQGVFTGGCVVSCRHFPSNTTVSTGVFAHINSTPLRTNSQRRRACCSMPVTLPFLNRKEISWPASSTRMFLCPVTRSTVQVETLQEPLVAMQL